MEKASDAVTFTIYGEPASKANSRRAVVIRGVPKFIKSAKALSYSKDFIRQCPVLDGLMQGDVAVTVKIYYASRRPDLDESLLLDLMQERIYLNDRQVKEKHVSWGLDKDNPRAVITVVPLSHEEPQHEQHP